MYVSACTLPVPAQWQTTAAAWAVHAGMLWVSSMATGTLYIRTLTRRMVILITWCAGMYGFKNGVRKNTAGGRFGCAGSHSQSCKTLQMQALVQASETRTYHANGTLSGIAIQARTLMDVLQLQRVAKIEMTDVESPCRFLPAMGPPAQLHWPRCAQRSSSTTTAHPRALTRRNFLLHQVLVAVRCVPCSVDPLVVGVAYAT